MSALDDLQAVIYEWQIVDTVIKPTLHRRANGPNYWYRLRLVEVDEDDQQNQWYNQKFNNCVTWVDDKLKDWPNCKRMAHDMWDFKYRKDAEKFITVFHLSWHQ